MKAHWNSSRLSINVGDGRKAVESLEARVPTQPAHAIATVMHNCVSLSGDSSSALLSRIISM